MVTKGGILEGTHAPWPELPWGEWVPTLTTVHMWTQIVGKVRMALAPPLNHWWHATLYVSSRGLTTCAIPYRSRHFEVEFDFVAHRLRVTASDAQTFTMQLEPKSVARFYRELMDGLRGMGIEVHIWTRPQEVVEAIPFETDEVHADYDPHHAQLLWRALLNADRVMKSFQTGFLGKASPVHFFWGSFDIAASRFSGRTAPRHPGGAPNCPDWVMEEAYSHEVSSAGWWPAQEPPGPAFYAYTYPQPDGYPSAPIAPAGAYFDATLGDFLLPYDAVRGAADPDGAVLEFLQSAYAAGADLGGWDRSALEPAVRPGRPPRAAWSIRGAGTVDSADREQARARRSSRPGR